MLGAVKECMPIDVPAAVVVLMVCGREGEPTCLPLIVPIVLAVAADRNHAHSSLP